MAVTISNVGARSIFRQNSAITYGEWKTGNQISVGYYASAEVCYVIQLRFRLDKPCSSIKIKTTTAYGSNTGDIYWKVSDKEADDELITRMVTVGNEPDATKAGSWETFEIEGNFPADTDLYIYGYNYSEYHNAITIYGLYDSDEYTKVIDATEAEYYAVSYEPGARGSGETAGATKIEGFPLTLEGAIFTRVGYTQTGWSTADGGEKVYELSGNYTANEAATLYPYWTANSYTLTLYPHGGKFADGGKTEITLVEELSFDSTSLNSLAAYAARKNGCGFMGWYTPDGTKVYDGKGACVRGTPYWDAEGRYIYPGDLSLYARWRAGVVLWVLFYIATKGKVKSGLWAIRSGNTITIYRAYSATQDGGTLEVR